ncbi:energy transducer TonB [Brevundimonas sp.]|uniref:energy transducer TonB n=1 Tax=Brevundimonas sp. TaxID=1871086 RepID=UPI002D246EC5|nr:energy transducer TonB [Brevundimonas sp.]HYD27163.1 energy transducer TonB [Brevundimonas sp.]
MRKPFQSLRLALGASVAAAGLAGALPAVAQQAPPVAVPPPLPIPPTQREDRIVTRPPDIIGPPVVVRPGGSPPPRPSMITNPAWVRSPAPEYPRPAIAAGVESGRVTLSCIVLPNGRLNDCVVRNESPPGLGFAESALAATIQARVSPRTVDGAAENARVTFTVRYMLPPEPEPLPPPPLPPPPPRR